MPILVALAAIIVVAAAMSMGETVGHDAGFMLRLVGVPVLAVVILAGLWLYHRRKSHALIVARYMLRGDALGWRKVRVNAGSELRSCAECGALVHDYWSQEDHAAWHEDLAKLLAGEPLEPDRVPWSAVTEHSEGQEPAEPAELDEARPPGAWRQVRDVLRIRPPAEQLEQPEPEPAQLEGIGEYEAKGRAFRAGMDRLKAENSATTREGSTQ